MFNSKIYLLSPVFLLFFLHLSFSPACAWTGRVIGVADGDTIKVLHNDEAIRIRLYGIDTPEKKQAFGNRAKKFTNALVRKKTVRIDPITRDRYGRTVALVSVHGVSLNEALVQAGYAWVYPKYCKKNICEDWYCDEALARKNSKGLWHDPDPVPPWKWRKTRRNRR